MLIRHKRDKGESKREIERKIEKVDKTFESNVMYKVLIYKIIVHLVEFHG